jgi:spore germination protein
MKTEQLNPAQLMTLTTAAIFGADVLIVQQRIAAIAKQDAWISLSIGGLLTIAAGAVAYYLATLHPDKDLPQIFLEVFGKVFGRILILSTAVYLILYLGFQVRVFAQALKMFLVDRTPIFAMVLMMGIAITYAVYKGLSTMGIVVDIIFPVTVFTIALILILALPQADTMFIKPILFENAANVRKAIIPSFQEFTGYNSILYFYCHSKRSRGSFLFYLAGLLIPILSYVALTVVSIIVFGPKDLVTLIFPTLTLLKAIEFPATFLERLESFAAVLWIGVVFTSAILFAYAATRNLISFFSVKYKYQRYVVFAQTPVIWFIALYFESGVVVLEYMGKIGWIQAFTGLIITPVLLIITLVKKRKKAAR